MWNNLLLRKSLVVEVNKSEGALRIQHRNEGTTYGTFMVPASMLLLKGPEGKKNPNGIKQ